VRQHPSLFTDLKMSHSPSIPIPVPLLYPLPAEDEINAFVGLPLHHPSIPTPAAVIDLSLASANCNAMLAAVSALSVSFRAHVKTHKTSQLTRLQVGKSSKDIRLIVSTVIEAEQLLPLLHDYILADAKVNILYGVPLGPFSVPRLAKVAKILGQGSLTVMIDHVDQLPALQQFKASAGFPAKVFVKVDAGTHRAGVDPSSPQMAGLLYEILSMEGAGDLTFNGYYSHAGHSYGGNSPDDAMSMLKLEIDVCKAAASRAPAHAFKERRVVFSVGASPTALSVQNLQSGKVSSNAARSLQEAMHLDQASFELELHAGVYSLLDMQQAATRARHFDGDPHDAIALTILAEVRSLYPERERPEALVAAGTVALGREPCKDYRGWGVVTPWRFEQGEDVGDRLIVSRISQEHGILAFEHNSHRNLSLRVGQKIRIWPNHACIASSGYGWYLVVDSKSESPDEVKEVWPRWRGW
jgi:D-serine deaminase-like pyridoxal phosphate-dependent protein